MLCWTAVKWDRQGNGVIYCTVPDCVSVQPGISYTQSDCVGYHSISSQGNVSRLLPTRLVCSTPYTLSVCVRCDPWRKQAQDQLRLSVTGSNASTCFFHKYIRCHHTSLSRLLCSYLLCLSICLSLGDTQIHTISLLERSAWAGLSACADVTEFQV